MIFAADDVGERGVALEDVALKLGDEADADAGDGCFNRNACIHEGEDAATDGGHRGGAVGFADFAADADGVWEVGGIGDDGRDGALGECAVADFAAVHSAHAAGFADAEWREVVMQDEALAGFAAGVTVEFLCFVARCESGEAECLRFAACEECAAVGAGQEADFAAERTDVAEAATIAALLAIQNGDAEGFLLQIVKCLADLEGRGLVAHLFCEIEKIAILRHRCSPPQPLP